MYYILFDMSKELVCKCTCTEYNKLWILQVHTLVTDNDKLHVPL